MPSSAKRCAYSDMRSFRVNLQSAAVAALPADIQASGTGLAGELTNTCQDIVQPLMLARQTLWCAHPADGYVQDMSNLFGIALDQAWLRRAAAENVTETVIAAVSLLHDRSVGEIAGKLTPAELADVTRLVSRCPSCYPPGAYEALKALRNVTTEQSATRATAGTGANRPLRGHMRASADSNRYGITFDSAWTEWAAREEVSETIAAAVLLICQTRPVHELPQCSCSLTARA